MPLFAFRPTARVANYGLMDQMAALHWIQQNIEKFGGNPLMITLVGHGTGAACIDFLMSSPTMGECLDLVSRVFNKAQISCPIY